MQPTDCEGVCGVLESGAVSHTHTERVLSTSPENRWMEESEAAHLLPEVWAVSSVGGAREHTACMSLLGLP